MAFSAHVREAGLQVAIFPTAQERIGFVAAPTSSSGELQAAAKHCAATRGTLLVSSADAVKTARDIRRTSDVSIILDVFGWRSAWASPDMPTALHEGFGLAVQTPGEWAQGVLRMSGANAVLVPAYMVKAGDQASLSSLLETTATCATPELIDFVPTEAQALSRRHIAAFVDVLKRYPGRQRAFLFADRQEPLAKFDRIEGLRRLLAAFPDSLIVGVDALVGIDALAHGASWVGVGASSSRRWPKRPGDSGGGPLADGYLPGTWLRELLEMRSPSFYADWYANAPSPTCRRCDGPLDLFEPTWADKTAIIEHNLHGIRDFGQDMLEQPPVSRIEWLKRTRLRALQAHAELHAVMKKVEADRLLRRMCEVDDEPNYRQTTPDGRWR